MSIKASEGITNKIKEFEGFRSKPYPDAKTGKMATGYGDTDNPAVTVTKEEADARLKNRIKLAEDELSSVVKREDLTQMQKDVLVDMHYNMGLSEMEGFINKINNRQDDIAGQSLNDYVHSTDVKTGKKFVVPALKDRAAYRTQLWSSPDGAPITQTSPGIPTQASYQADPYFVAEMDDMAAQVIAGDMEEPEQTAITPDANFESDMDSMVADIQADNEGANPVDKKQMLDVTSDSVYKESSSNWLMKRAESERLSKKLGLSMVEARSLLEDYTPEEILARNANALTAQHFPAVAQWGQQQDNYVLRQKTGDTPHKIEIKSRSLNSQDGDFEKAWKSNGVTLHRDAIHLGMLTGSVDFNEGKRVLRELDVKMQDLKQTKNLEVRRKIDSSWNNMELGLKKIQDGSLLDGSYDVVANYLHALALYTSNPSEYAQEIVQSGTSFIPSGLVILGAAMTGSGVGAIAGVTTISAGVGLSGLMSFGSRMDDSLNDYKNAEGIVDYDKAFSDPERVARWRTESGIYAGAMAASDAILGKVAGKIATGGKAVLSKIKKVAVSSVIEEAGSEFVAASSADAYSGNFSKNLPKNLKSAIQEATISPGFAIAGSVGGKASIMALNTVRKQASKTMSKLKTSAKAKDNADSLRSTRSEVNASPDMATAKTQASDLINESVSKGYNPSDAYSGDTDNPTQEELIARDKIEADATLSFSPAEFDEFIKSKGFDPEVVIQNLSPETQQLYKNNRQSDSSVIVSMGEWLTFQGDDALDGIDDIARFPESFINGEEGKENIDEVSKDPMSFLQTGLPPIPDEEGENMLPPPVPQEALPSDTGPVQNIGAMDIIEPTEAEGNIISRPVQLISRFRSKEHQSMMKKVLAAVKRASFLSPDIDPASLDAIAEIQYNHLRYRAEVLGMPVKDLLTLKFGRMSDKKSKQEDYTIKGSFNWLGSEATIPEAITKILLAKSADLPTIIHELGHSWLHDMVRDSGYVYGLDQEALTPNQTEYKRAMEDVAEMFGLKNISDIARMSGKEMERVHEKFAQTTEKYFLEGTFANSNIKAVMESLRKWLVHLAGSIGMAYPHHGSFKIDPKVEKLFETILGASQKVEDAVLPLIDDPMFDPKMLGAEGPKYLGILKDVENESMANTYGKAFTRSEKQREAEGLKRLAEFKAKAEAEVDTIPEFALLKYFKDAYAEYSKTKEGVDPRFSFESVVETLFNGDEEGAMAFKKQIPMQVISGKKKGGSNIVSYMVENGIFDAQTMASMLAEMTNRDMRVDELVDKMIDEALPTIKTDEEIHRIAEEEVQNTSKERRIKFEMDILATKYLPTLKGVAAKLINPARYVGKEAKALILVMARTKVMQSPAAKFRPKTFLVDSDRKGRASSKFFKANDIMEAMNSKYQQMVDFKAYEEAQKAFYGMAKTEKAIKKILKYAGRKEAAPYYDIEVLNQGRRIIAEASKGKVSPMPMSVINESSGMNPDMVDAINMAVNRYNALSHEAPTKLNSVAARLSLGEVLSQVLKASSAARKIEIAGEKSAVNDTALTFASELSEYKGSLEFRSKEGIRARRKSDITPIRWMFEALLGDKFYKSAAFGLLGDITNSEGVAAVEKKSIKDAIVNAYKPLIKKDPGLKGIIYPILKRGTPEALQKAVGITEAPIISKELGTAFRNTGELLKAMLLMGSESGALNYLARNTTSNISYNLETGAVDRTKYTEFIQRLIDEGTLTEDHVNFLNTVWEIFNGLHPKINEAMREVDGYNIGKIEGTKQTFIINGKEVTLLGGYAPISVEADFKTPTGNADFLTLDSHGVSALGLYRQGIGLTKERTGGVDPIDLDLSTLTAYTNAAVDIAHLRRPLSNFRKVFLHPEVKAVMREKAPGAMDEVVSPWFQRTVSQVFTEYSTHKANRIARSARKGANMALYALNVFSGLRQTFGLLQTLRRVDPAYVRAAATQTILKRSAIKTSILKESAFMKERYDTSIRDGHRSIEQLELVSDWITKASDVSQLIGTFLSQQMQQYVDLITWQSSFLKAQDDGLTREQARNVADDTVMRTQGSMAASALSNIQAGTDVYKFIMMATNIPLINLNDLGLQLNKNQDNKAVAKGIAGVVAISIAAPIIMEDMVQRVIAEMFGADDEEDEEEKRKKADRRLAAKVAGNIGSTLLPISGRVVESIALYNQPSLGPGFNVLAKGMQAYTGTKNLTRGVDLSYREKRAMLDMATFLSGRPEFSMVSRMVEFGQATKSSEELEEERYTRQYQIEDLKNDLY
jgi:GH24 family phage-related lysozyme (muramidase)